MPFSTPLAIVTPWWSERCSGGAEFLARELAMQLSQRGFTVEVLTTCSRSAFSDWAENYYAEGCDKDNGLTVRRFPVSPRDAARFAYLYTTISKGRWLSNSEEMDFLSNSINSHALCAFIEENRSGYVFCFLPYLYGTTFYGIQAGGGRSVIIPCLHNEPIAYLTPFQKMMGSARGLWFLSDAEYFFARALYPIQNVAARVVGAGMDFCGRGDGERFRRTYNIEGPYLIAAGRRVPGKGFDLLDRCFGAFVERHPHWRLVRAGLGGESATAETAPGVLDLGYMEKQDLWDAMAGATVFCQPSYYESFSYVLMEAWSQGTPALVNAHCDVLRQQCEAADGGLWFADAADFERALVFLETHPDIARQLGEQGRRYVEENFRWSDVLDRAEQLFRDCGWMQNE
ncbi:MAG: glycosyltransferase family 4 protein [Candidatus Sumerlaeia bacterium]|nr:glycosyltransferase family 4 protein [Candidatus Sumerlaeia bacterium]